MNEADALFSAISDAGGGSNAIDLAEFLFTSGILTFSIEQPLFRRSVRQFQLLVTWAKGESRRCSFSSVGVRVGDLVI